MNDTTKPSAMISRLIAGSARRGSCRGRRRRRRPWSGMARKNENSAAARLSAPSSMADDDGRAGPRHAGDHGETLHDADAEIHRQRERLGVVVARLEFEPVDPQQHAAADDQR